MAEGESPITYEQLEDLEDDFEQAEVEISTLTGETELLRLLRASASIALPPAIS
jgi:hypothetical protein